MKSVGIITMHRVLNLGSMLQAYALQESIRELGFKPEIIDYVYPNIEHQMYLSSSYVPKKLSLGTRVVRKIKSMMKCHRTDIDELRRQKFLTFMSTHYNLSRQRYDNRYLLCKTPPKYDIYITGSDQVWNPDYIGYDTSFMLGFVRDKDAKKIAYAPSVSIDEIPEQFCDDYSQKLKEYSSLSVREDKSVDVITRLAKRHVDKVCDPTLLFSRSEWITKILNTSNLENERKYFIVYILDYKYNPYPSIDKFIEQAHRRYGGDIIVINGKMSDYMKSMSAMSLPTADPVEFIGYLKNAKFLVTTSFHGTVFALNFGIPFLCVMDPLGTDTRIRSLLADYDAQKFSVCIDTDNLPEDTEYSENIHLKIKELRERSKKYLFDALYD